MVDIYDIYYYCRQPVVLIRSIVVPMDTGVTLNKARAPRLVPVWRWAGGPMHEHSPLVRHPAVKMAAEIVAQLVQPAMSRQDNALKAYLGWKKLPLCVAKIKATLWYAQTKCTSAPLVAHAVNLCLENGAAAPYLR